MELFQTTFNFQRYSLQISTLVMWLPFHLQWWKH